MTRTTNGLLQLRTAALLPVALLAWTSGTYALDLNGCDPVPARTVGVLQSNVTCSGQPLALGAGATLDLNGFAVTGDIACAPGLCAITSTGTAGSVVGQISAERAKVEDADIDCAGAAVGITVARKLTLNRVTVTNCSRYGIARAVGPANVRAENLAITSCAVGMELNSGTLRGSAITLSDNTGAGLYAGKALLTDVTAAGNGSWGLSAAKRLTVRGGSITGNGEAGIVAVYGKVNVHNANVSGNGVDIASARRPRVVNTTCGTSRIFADATIQPDSWGACPGE
jgi:hypothetical protein